ncbi:unnamed protein product [Staurois parvus]|uniref:Uncharacterized protein n=1 Tax=Staurois parvus TaxID=386267 RepID=A0ABN9FUY8_9NEOB|nr:unnamed protein product [Staurois parvus]
MLSLVCIARERCVFFLGGNMWSAQGQLALSRQRVRGFTSS